MNTANLLQQGLEAFSKRHFGEARTHWAPLLDAGEDLPLAFMSEHAFVTGDAARSLEWAQQRTLHGTTRPSAAVQCARALLFVEGPEDERAIGILMRAEENQDPDSTAWLAEALQQYGDNGAASRMWRKAAQRGNTLAVLRVIELLGDVDPSHPEIAGWQAIAQKRGINLSDPVQGSALGVRELPHPPLGEFIRAVRAWDSSFADG